MKIRSRPPWTRLLSPLALLFLTHLLPAAPAADPFAEGVRPTLWKSPQDEQQTFHLPPGFEIQLVAAEPDINKPLNLAFDAAGRLWVTTSIEYPYAAPTNKPGRDRLMIFEDFGPDGRARKVTEFAGGLNIPIGIYPFYSPSNSKPETRNPKPGTWKAVVWSIPNIWLFEDTDGDGKADKREVLYGTFNHTRDTHGNQASFRRGFDGWLYATHGYNNDSHVKGRDGHQIDLNSGNTYRLRLDGSRIEQHTHGQVNPFGLAFDEFGNLFSSDCHSEPIYQLLAGGYYPSFGKPHDGLGFVPKMMEKPRGSTAIDGISIYNDDLWPAEFHGNIFIGDVMASRVFRDRVTEEGSTRIARPMPDFVTTEDPWFRPVDTQLGPDGALYIADFYNKIIGHYEVPLTHPGRDRTSGRIWRVVKSRAGVSPARSEPWTPAGAGETPALLWPRFDFTKMSANELVVELSHPNLTRRMLAMNTLGDRFGTNVLPYLGATARGERIFSDSEKAFAARAHALWLFHRLGLLDDETLTAAARDRDRTMRVHAMRILAERGLQAASTPETGPARSGLKPALRQLAITALDDKDALVQRCAAEALGNWPAYENVPSLLSLVERVPKEDTHLLYVARKALRDQLVPEENFQRLAATKLTDAERDIVVDLSLAVKSPAAATFLLRQLPELSKARNPSLHIADILKHAARYAPESELDQLASFALARIPTARGVEQYQEIERQFSLFKSVDEGLQQRGRDRPETLRAWGTNLVWKCFEALDGYHAWAATAYEPNPTDVPWDIEIRSDTDGQKHQLISSLPHGEDLTGVLRSPEFPMPAKLSFWLCGHDGFPDKPAGHLNFVRLRLAPEPRLQAASPSAIPNGPGSADAPAVAASGSGANAALPGAIIATAPAPRNDIARRITWELPDYTGKRVIVEAVDGDDGRAFAWIAFGGFQPEMSQLRPSEFSPRKMRDWFTAATETAVRLQMKESAPILAHFVSPQRGVSLDRSDAEMLSSLARAWVALEPAQAIPVLASALTTNYGPVAYREGVAGVLAAQDSPSAQAAVLAAVKSLPLKSQEKICFTLASAKFSAETLLAGLESGAISPRVLHRVGVNTRLKSSKPTDWEARLKKLTAKLPPPDDARNKLIADRRAAYSTAPGQPGAGKLIFVKQCAACHRIGTDGAVIGPQLDGIGQRGLERLCEDILDPNRNVDGAFRTTLLTLKDGDLVSGLFRREEGETIVLAESTGKEITVAKGQIKERRESETSLMPENVGEILSTAEFNDLMAFLLSKGAVSQ